MKQLSRAGKLDQVVTLYHRTLTADGRGGSTQALTAYATDLWAGVEVSGGDERQEAMRTEGRRRYTVTLRHRTDVLDTDVVEWNGRQMNVRRVDDAGPRPLYLTMECEMGARL